MARLPQPVRTDLHLLTRPVGPANIPAELPQRLRWRFFVAFRVAHPSGVLCRRVGLGRSNEEAGLTSAGTSLAGRKASNISPAEAVAPPCRVGVFLPSGILPTFIRTAGIRRRRSAAATRTSSPQRQWAPRQFHWVDRHLHQERFRHPGTAGVSPRMCQRQRALTLPGRTRRMEWQKRKMGGSRVEIS